MPAKRNTSAKESSSAATIGFEALAKCEVRCASADAKKSRPFVIRNSAFGICPVLHLAPQGMAGRCKVRAPMSEVRSCCSLLSTFKVQHSSFAPSSNQSGEGEIRRALIGADLVDCMIALPKELFYSTQIPVWLWFLAKNKAADSKRGFRDRRKEPLFIDARKLGTTALSATQVLITSHRCPSNDTGIQCQPAF